MGSYSLRIDPTAGAAGDMFLGCFYSLLQNLESQKEFQIDIDTINLKLVKLAQTFGAGFDVLISREQRGEVEGVKIGLNYGGEKSHSHHVTYVKLNNLLERLNEQGVLTKPEVEASRGILLILAEAEALAHEVDLPKVHFHEIGEEDSVFDIIASGILISSLKSALSVDQIMSLPVEVGTGFVETSHGRLSIPAPATQNIVNACGLNITSNLIGECLTPTGAAVLAYLNPKFLKLLENTDVDIVASGIGCGTRNPIDRSNILKIELIKGL